MENDVQLKYVSNGFHERHDDLRYIGRKPARRGKRTVHVTGVKRSVSYAFTPHYHPYLRELVDTLIQRGIRGLEEKDTQYRGPGGTILGVRPEVGPEEPPPEPVLHLDIFTDTHYKPAAVVQKPFPVEELDFSPSGAYGVYNWELFFHVPLTVAINLSRNQRFAEAQRWLHYIFDPTDDGEGPTPERFWKVKPFQTTDLAMIDEILTNLSTGKDELLRQETINAIGAWKDEPFRPHVIARFRHSAYMLKTVMTYLDNLIAWGDSLFRQDTGETIVEATQLYVTAANILGPRPQVVPEKGTLQTQTYASLKPELDEFGNAMRKLEDTIPFNIVADPPRLGDGDRLAPLQSVGGTLYFCIPRNDRMLAFWDTVADRLFKIRNSLNIQGIFRQLPLFEPPIDPALLARAAAAGLDIAAVVAGANQPLPLVRFQVLLQRATELCQEVKSLGGGLLSALEKEDAEALSILRAKHERVILGLAESVRYGQWQEAIKNREAMEQAIANAAHRYAYYERLLGTAEGEVALPELEALDAEGLLKLKFKAGEPTVTLRSLPVQVAQNLGETGGKKLSPEEVEELKKLKDARKLEDVASILELLASNLAVLPNVSLNMHYWGIGGSMSFDPSRGPQFLALATRTLANKLTYLANNTAKIGTYARRELEWAFQSNVAAGEISHLYKQLRAAQVREALAERELQNHQQQMKHAEEIEAFLTDQKTGKKTNQALYAWMNREVRGLYSQCFQFAFDVAKKAERAIQYELGDPGLSFLQFGYTAGKEGLLSGEKLYFDLKRMEMAYHDLNQRELELTKHVSLLQLDPEALLQLRQSGRCTISLPEELFDMGGAGHYFRRIKSVAVTIPCVVGPYTSVNCTVSLLKSAIRISPAITDAGYARVDASDPRFQERTGGIQSIVTSSGQNDSGLFEVNLRDDRYLPFEGAGAVSDWQLKLPDIKQFDHDTIRDVILHVRYTARDGGEPLAAAATTRLNELIELAEAAGTTRLFAVHEEFPSEWMNFKRVGGALTLPLRPEHYPFWTQQRKKNIARIDVFARDGNGAKVELGDLSSTLSEGDPTLEGLARGTIVPPDNATADGDLTLTITQESPSALWIAVTWSEGQ